MCPLWVGGICGWFVCHAGSERFVLRSRGLRGPTFYPVGSGCAVAVPRSRLLRAQRSEWWEPSEYRRLSARVRSAHTPPGPASAASGRSGRVGSRAQAQRAPLGTRPVSARRHSAISSLRARATIITRRARPPAVRSRYHRLSALSGWKRSQRHAIWMSWARIQPGPSRPIPWSRRTSPLAHGTGAIPTQLASSRRFLRNPPRSSTERRPRGPAPVPPWSDGARSDPADLRHPRRPARASRSARPTGP